MSRRGLAFSVRSGPLALGALAVALCVATPSTAVARTSAVFDIAGDNGFRLIADVSRQRASLTALKLAFPFASISAASYETKGSLAGDRVRVRFGNRGRIAVVFRPSGRVKRRFPPTRCEGRPKVTRFGVFVGTIKFRGEQGYTGVDATRVQGQMRTTSRWRCRRGRSAAARELGLFDRDRISLDVTAARSRTSLEISATRPPEEHGDTSFSVTRIERRGSMVISRILLVDGRERTFVFGEALDSATVAPPPPFSGSATFALEPDGSSAWRGSLRVDLPGAEGISLANDTYTARLYRP